MKFIEEYRDREIVLRLSEQIRKKASGKYCFMEVCGGHTSSIHRFGIPSLLPEDLKLISGPGCPVCVTPTDFIDRAIEYSKHQDVIITTFGDLLRVPGSASSLEREKLNGADVRIVISGLDALNTAETNPNKNIIFLGIGFETTAPGTAVTVKKAKERGLRNFMVISAHKIMPPALEAILKEDVSIDGLICPGHVATITGSGIFRILAEKHRLGCVITGFEPTDILQSVLMLLNQVNSNNPSVEIQYTRAVTPEGNLKAQELMSEVFELSDANWRGFGNIPASGLILKQEFELYDADKRIPVTVISKGEDPSCICGNILRGRNRPTDCPLYRIICTPDNPVGACMVSPEGACNSYFKYFDNE